MVIRGHLIKRSHFHPYITERDNCMDKTWK